MDENRARATAAQGGQETLSLREIGRRLGIPPSSVVYYKDRFGAFVPVASGRGRRKRYPLRALDVFREIRAMYDDNKAAGQIERELALRFGAASGAGAGACPDADLSRSVSRVVDKMAGVLDAQQVYRAEIEALRREVRDLRVEMDRREAEHAAALDAARAEAEALRREKCRLEDYVRRRIEQGNPLHSRPGAEFMALPLVILSDRKEFLGLGGKARGCFTPQSLLSLIQSSQRAGRSVETFWDRDQEHWILRVRVQGGEREQNIVFMLRRTLTPSRNLVARLAHMIVDGQEVPEPYLLSLFRQIRESFNA